MCAKRLHTAELGVILGEVCPRDRVVLVELSSPDTHLSLPRSSAARVVLVWRDWV